jgi:hypothetical protein
MATFSPKGRIDVETVTKEITRLTRLWSGADRHGDGLDMLLGAETLASIDPFDRVQLAHVVETCQASRSLSEAGRQLFAASRESAPAPMMPTDCGNIWPAFHWTGTWSARSGTDTSDNRPCLCDAIKLSAPRPRPRRSVHQE